MDNKYPGLAEILRNPTTEGQLILGEPLRKVKPLSHIMLRDLRGYVIDKVKKPIKKAITILANRYPQPTKENTLNPNTHILLDIQDRFFQHETLPERKEMFRAIFKLFIAEYEHDPYYRSRINWVIEELVEATMDGKWLPRGANRPINYWKEDKPFGLYEGRRFKKLIRR